ncbi:MAG: SMI1/KNR4 family protein [Oligoflexales bacterium]
MKKVKVYRDFGKIDRQSIITFARTMGVTFPEDYITLLSEHDALRPEKCDFWFTYEDKVDSRDIAFLGFSSCINEANQIARFQQDEYGWEKVIVFGRAANGDYICFDYRSHPDSKNPPVVLMFHDDYDNKDRMITVNVAPNFQSFIDNLVEAEE